MTQVPFHEGRSLSTAYAYARASALAGALNALEVSCASTLVDYSLSEHGCKAVDVLVNGDTKQCRVDQSNVANFQRHQRNTGARF